MNAQYLSQYMNLEVLQDAKMEREIEEIAIESELMAISKQVLLRIMIRLVWVD